jgi:hypothetical protein
MHIQFGWFGVLIEFRFHYLHLSRGTDFNLVGLGIPLRFIAKPSYSAKLKYALTLAAIA